MTFLEVRRAHAQQMYKEEVDFIEKNKEELIRQKEQAQEEGMKVRLFSELLIFVFPYGHTLD
jgi:hypothetical protein